MRTADAPSPDASLQTELPCLDRAPGPRLWRNNTAAGWFDALDARLDAWLLRRASLADVPTGLTESSRAAEVVHRACIRSALLGGATGTATTLAAVAVVAVGGGAAPAVAPLAAIASGTELILREGVHAELAASLAAVVGLPLDTAQPADGARLHDLMASADVSMDRDRALVTQLLSAGGGELLAGGHSLSRASAPWQGLVPVLGIAVASLCAWRTTRDLGQKMHARLKRQRDLARLLEGALARCRDDAELLIEGVWFTLTAAGPLDGDGATVLAALLRACDPIARGALVRRMTDDERDWLGRLVSASPSSWDAMQTALHAVGDTLGHPAPVRRLLRRVQEILTVPELHGDVPGAPWGASATREQTVRATPLRCSVGLDRQGTSAHA